MKNYFDKPWSMRPWWFNLLVSLPVSILTILFTPIGYIIIPRFRRYINGIFTAVDSDYAHLHDAHKHDTNED